MQQSIDKIKPEMDKVINFFKKEMQKLRSGKASPSLIEDIVVDCLGSKLPLKQIATISCPEPRQLLVQPWAREYLEGIEKALQRADLGTSPIVEGEMIRITLPSMTTEFRDKLINQVAQKGEEAYQTLRKWRDEAWKDLQDRFHKKEISEDDKFRGKEKLQELIDEYHEKIEQLKQNKKKEITS